MGECIVWKYPLLLWNRKKQCEKILDKQINSLWKNCSKISNNAMELLDSKFLLFSLWGQVKNYKMEIVMFICVILLVEI